MIPFPTEFAGALSGDSIQPTPVSNLYVTENAVGQAQTRPKTTSQLMQYPNVQFIFTVGQYAIWRSWFKSTLRWGSLKFEMVDPIDGATKEFKIVPANPPYTATSIGRDKWRITCSLEYVDA